MAQYGWLPLLGNYEEEDGAIVFRGNEIKNADNTVVPGLGNLIFNEYFNEGKIKTEIEFTEIDNETGCDIILHFKNNENSFEMVTVGIDKGTSFMFELKSVKDGRWNFHKFSGDSNAIKKNFRYKIEVEYKGNLVNLKVNDIDVLVGKLPFATTMSQVGIWCRSRFDIKIYNFIVENNKPKAFVIMQFSEQFNELYNDVISNICKKYNFEAVRADDIYRNEMIIHDITKNITEAKVVIADVTPKNPNVYYEVGYSHAIGKPTILLAEEGTELPFDVRPYRVIFYKNSIGGRKNIEESLEKHLMQII